MARPRTPKGRGRLVVERLAEEYPDAGTELDFTTPWELLVATILSAQTTDVRVNEVTPKLFSRYPLPADLAAADAAEVEQIVFPTGFYRNKARSIMGAAAAVAELGGVVPDTIDGLVKIPGVGRKTANVIVWVAFAKPGIAVDTHVQRLSHRLALTEQTDPVKIERDLRAIVPARDLGPLGLRLILHGRRVCVARRPRCDRCVMQDFCPSAFSV